MQDVVELVERLIHDGVRQTKSMLRKWQKELVLRRQVKVINRERYV